MEIPFVGQAYKARTLAISAQTCVNMFLSANAPGSKTPVALKPSPGLEEFADLDTQNKVEGVIASGDSLFAMSDRKLFKINTGGGVTEIGELDGGPMSMAYNGTQTIIANELGGWTYTDAGGLAAITDTDFLNATSISYLDGYFLITRPDSEQFFLSALRDGTAYDALDYTTAEGIPDKIVCGVKDNREYWVFGEESAEIYYNSGDASFPFERGVFSIDTGCIARWSVVSHNNMVFWLSNDLTVNMASSTSPQKISTDAIDEAIATYTNVGDAYGFFYAQDSHAFYVITFPSDGVTWCYDVTTGAWHQRSSQDYDHWRPQCYAKFKNMHIVGDSKNGKLYKLIPTLRTEAGNEIVRERTTQYFRADGKEVFMSKLEILFSAGVGELSGQGYEPVAMLQWSDDDGKTWSNEHWAKIGKQGDYRHRAIWKRLGRFRNRTFRVRISDPVEVVILGATGEATVGNR